MQTFIVILDNTFFFSGRFRFYFYYLCYRVDIFLCSFSISRLYLYLKIKSCLNNKKKYAIKFLLNIFILSKNDSRLYNSVDKISDETPLDKRLWGLFSHFLYNCTRQESLKALLHQLNNSHFSAGRAMLFLPFKPRSFLITSFSINPQGGSSSSISFIQNPI